VRVIKGSWKREARVREEGGKKHESDIWEYEGRRYEV